MKEKLRIVLLVLGLVCVTSASAAIFSKVHWRKPPNNVQTETNADDKDNYGSLGDFQLDENELPLIPYYDW